VIGVQDAANFVALGLHALQHRGQEAGGIITHDPEPASIRPTASGWCATISPSRRDGIAARLHRPSAMCAIPPPGPRGHRNPRRAALLWRIRHGRAAIAHNGNITNAEAIRRELIERGSIFQSSSDSECIIH
jgi:amidophosphoribosyltransferase